MTILSMAAGLAEFVPSILQLIMGDEAGQVAEKVVDTARKVTGQRESDEIKKLLRESPQLVLQFQREIEELSARLAQGFIEDRQHARTRDVALSQQGRYNWRADIMVLAAAGGLVCCLVTLAFFRHNLGGEAIGIISTVSGIFGSCLKDAYAFEFGSSRENASKDSMLQFLLNRPGPHNKS